MTDRKILAGSAFPSIIVTALDGSQHDLADRNEGRWKMVVVYRGRHCPLCTKYLNKLEGYLRALDEIDVDVVAVTADSREQVEDQLTRLDVSFPMYHGLTIEQMEKLGLYISHPRSPQETDHPFPEPGLFVINNDGEVHVVDLSNNPFVRPELDALTSGLGWIKNPDNNYPIRGTYP